MRSSHLSFVTAEHLPGGGFAHQVLADALKKRRGFCIAAICWLNTVDTCLIFAAQRYLASSNDKQGRSPVALHAQAENPQSITVIIAIQALRTSMSASRGIISPKPHIRQYM